MVIYADASIAARQIQHFLANKVQNHLLQRALASSLLTRKYPTHPANRCNPRDEALAEVPFDVVLLGIAHATVRENLHSEQ